MTRYLYSARLVPIEKPVCVPFVDGSPPELSTFTDESFEVERTSKTKPPIYVNHDKGLQIGRVGLLSRDGGWWCADFMLDADVPEDIEFEVGQNVSVGIQQLKIGSCGTFLQEVSIVRRGAVKGAQITRRFALEPKRLAESPAAAPTSAVAGEVIYGNGKTITRYFDNAIVAVGGKPLLRTTLGQVIRREGRDYVIDQPDGSQVIYSGAEGYREALRDGTLGAR